MAYLREELLGATNAAAVRARSAWLAHISLGAYLFVIVGGTTHQDLLLGTPVKLPILQVELPIQGFYALAPFVFWLMHLNLLVQLNLLANKLRRFMAELEASATKREADHLRSRLDLFVYGQLVAGTDLTPAARILMWLMVRVTTVLGPLALLLAFQLRYLPYHDQWMTWSHRFWVTADLALLIALWSSARTTLSEERNRFLGLDWSWIDPWRNRLWTGSVWCSAAVVLVVSVFFATIPGESVEYFWPANSAGIAEARRMILEAPPDFAASRPGGLFARNVVIPDFRRGKDEPPLSLRNRDLRNAELRRSNLRGADLTATDLSKAQLEDAQLDQAQFECADRRGQRVCARLSEASLSGAYLRGANLSRADIRGARMIAVDLSGADLSYTNLSGVNLGNATLLGANLAGADLTGALIVEADLRMGRLFAAELSGAVLVGTNLVGANLNSARMMGTNLRSARLWRAFIPDQEYMTNTKLVNLEEVDLSSPSPVELERMQHQISGLIAPQRTREELANDIKSLREPKYTTPDSVLNSRWRNLATRWTPQAGRELTDVLSGLACQPNTAPHVAWSMIEALGIEQQVTLGTWPIDIERFAGALDRCADRAQLRPEDTTVLAGMLDFQRAAEKLSPPR